MGSMAGASVADLAYTEYVDADHRGSLLSSKSCRKAWKLRLEAKS
jgi:hypothetical protein